MRMGQTCCFSSLKSRYIHTYIITFIAVHNYKVIIYFLFIAVLCTLHMSLLLQLPSRECPSAMISAYIRSLVTRSWPNVHNITCIKSQDGYPSWSIVIVGNLCVRMYPSPNISVYNKLCVEFTEVPSVTCYIYCPNKNIHTRNWDGKSSRKIVVCFSDIGFNSIENEMVVIANAVVEVLWDVCTKRNNMLERILCSCSLWKKQSCKINSICKHIPNFSLFQILISTFNCVYHARNTQITMSIFILQTFRSLVATSHPRQPIAFWSHNSPDTPWLALLMNIHSEGGANFQ